MTKQNTFDFPWADAASRAEFLLRELSALNLMPVLHYVESYNSPITTNSTMLHLMHYHSTEHMKQVTSIALALLGEEGKYPWQWDNGALPLAVACLFHDMDHSLGTFDDAFNVLNAQHAFNKYLEETCNDPRIHAHKEIILDLIGVTQFPYTDDRKPKNLIERCIRDADILYGVQDDALDLVMVALREEVNRNQDTYTAEQWAQGRIEFLLNTDLYTSKARAMMYWQLAEANDHNHQSKISSWLGDRVIFNVAQAKKLKAGDVIYIDSSIDVVPKRHMIERLDDDGIYIHLDLDDGTTLALRGGENCITVQRDK